MSNGGTTGRARAWSRDRPPSLWRNHDFMVLWTGETVSTLGSAMSFFVFPLVGYSLTGSTTEAALAGSAFALGSVLAKLPAGALVDRWDRKRTLAWSNWAGALLYASLVVAPLLDRLTIGHLVVVALLTGVAGSFYRPAETAAIRTVVPPRQLPAAFSQNQARQHAAALIGPPLGGALYAVTRWAPFLLDAVSFVLAGLAVHRIRTPLPAPQRAAATGMVQEVAEGVRFVMSRGFLRAIVAFAALANFAGQAFFLVLTLKLLEAGVHPAAIGLVDTIGAVAGIAGAVAAPWLVRSLPTGPLSIGMSLLLVVAMVPMAFTDDVLLIGALLGLALLGNPAANVGVTSYLVTVTPDHLQGRCQAALGFCTSALMPLGPVLGGAAMAWWGGTVAMLAAAALTGLSVLPLLLSAETRALSTPDRWPTPTSQDPPDVAATR